MDHETQTAAAPTRRRFRFLLFGLLALAVLAGGGFYLAYSLLSPAPAAGQTTASARTAAASCGAAAAAPCTASPVDAAVAAPPAVAKVPPHPTGTRPSPSSSPLASPRPTVTVTATGAASIQPSASVSVAQGDTAAAQDDAAEAQVLALINQARSAAGLPALTVTSGLVASSSAHNLLMAEGCGLSHQCPGEAALGARETAAGVDWTAAGMSCSHSSGRPVAGYQKSRRSPQM
jgi:uncharacterized protein YkwD